MKILKSLKELIRSKHIHLALVTGTSMIILTYVSKRVLPEPMDNIYITIPGLFLVAAEAALGLKKNTWYTNVNHWIIAAVLATSLIVILHLK